MKPLLLTLALLAALSTARAGYEVQPTDAATSQSVVKLSTSFVPGRQPCDVDTVRIVRYTAPAGRTVLLRDYIWNYLVGNADFDVNLLRVSKDEQDIQLYVAPSSVQVGTYLLGIQTSDTGLLLESCEYRR